MTGVGEFRPGVQPASSLCKMAPAGGWINR
jgi:hypothetical protein